MAKLTEALDDDHLPHRPNADRWLLWPACAILFITFCLSLLCELPGLLSLILLLATASLGLVSIICILLLAGSFVIVRQWRTATSVGITAFIPVYLWKPIAWVTVYVHLGLTIGLGLGQIGKAEVLKESGIVAYDWSVGLASSPQTFLLYDKTDSVLRPVTRPADPYTMPGSIEDECSGNVTKLIGHYYICVF